MYGQFWEWFWSYFAYKIIPHCYKNLFKVSVMCGTAEFIAPEIVAYDNVCGATDMWAIGIFTFQ